MILRMSDYNRLKLNVSRLPEQEEGRDAGGVARWNIAVISET